MEGLSKKKLIAIVNKLQKENDALKFNSVSGLKNHNAYKQMLAETNSFCHNVSIFEIDTNFLKDMNDSIGHANGDKYLHTQADAMVDIMAVNMGLLEVDENQNLVIPQNAGRKPGMTDQEHVQFIKTKVTRERDIYHIGGDEFRILLKNKDKPPHMTEAEYLKSVIAAGHGFMHDVLARFAHLWETERGKLEDERGNPIQCSIDASFGYGLANSGEPRFKGKDITELQKVADNRAFLHKAWQKLTGRVKLPQGRSIDTYLSDPRLQGLAELQTFEDFLDFMNAKEAKYSGAERRSMSNFRSLAQEDRT